MGQNQESESITKDKDELFDTAQCKGCGTLWDSGQLDSQGYCPKCTFDVPSDSQGEGA